MKHISKRVMSLALILCLIAGFMVPSAKAEGPDTSGVLTYAFGHNNAMGLSKDHLPIADDEKYSVINTANGFVIDNKVAGTNESKFLLTSRAGAGVYWTAASYAVKFKQDNTYKHWYALQISDVKAGTYDMTFTAGRTSDGGLFKIHVLNLDEAGFRGNIPSAAYTDLMNGDGELSKSQNNAIYTAIDRYILNANSEVVFDSSSKTSETATKSIGCVTFPADGSYVLLIQSMGFSSATGASTSKCYASLSSLTMTPAIASHTADGITTAYASVDALVTGINNAASGTVKLLADISTTADLTIKNGVSLDLNGKTLTANTVTVAAGGELVYNGGTLNAELSQFTAEDEAAASAVQAKIDAIGEVTLESEAAINEADAAYAALTDNQKKLVNAAALVAAKQTFATLKADTAAAAPVQALIDAIGEVTLESEAAINEAVAAYNALTDSQKALVDTTKLVEAQKKLAQLKPLFELIYDFGGGEGLHLGTAEIVAPEGFIMGGDSEITERSRYITTSRGGSGAYWTQGAFALKFKTNSEVEKQWFAIQISNVKAGTYDAIVRVGKTSDGGLFKVHILNLDQAGFLANIPSEIMAKILAGTNLKQSENEAVFAAMDSYFLNSDNTVIHNSRTSDKGPAEESTGLVTFPADGNYVLMVQCMGPTASAPDAAKFWTNIAGLTLSPAVASVQNTADSVPVIYHDAQSAVAGINTAPEGAVATLISDVTTEGNVIVRKGVTLDLNGKTLTADSVIVIAGGAINYNGGELKAKLYEFTADEQAPADAANAKIAAIGEVTLESEAAINEAYAAYNALTDRQKMLVDILTLDAAKATFDQMKADKAAADAVQAKIDALGEITLESEAKINEAAAAYQALTGAQKALVDDTALIAAQKKLAELKYPGVIVPDDSDEDYVPIVESDYAMMDPISSVNMLLAATDTVTINGVEHDYLYTFFNGQVMMVFDLDDLNENGQPKLVDKERNAFGTPRGIYIDEDHIVWACGAGRMLYKYDPFTQVGERIELASSNELFPNISSFNSHGITGVPGSDWLYFGTYNRTFIGAYNKKTGELVRLSDVLTNANGIEDGLRAAFGGVVAKDGYLYLGVDGDANSDGVVSHEIIKFDLASKKIVDRLDVAGDYKMGSANWLENFQLVGENLILASIWRERHMTFAIDISGEKMQLIEIENLENNFNGGVSGERNGKVYFMGVDERGLLEYDIATGTVTDLGIALGTPTGQFMGSLLCTAGTGGWVTVDHPDLPGESLVTFTNNEELGMANLVFYNLETKKTVIIEDCTSGMGSGNQLEYLTLSEDKKDIYIGAYGNNQLGIYNVESGQMTDLIPTYSHQIESIIEYSDYIYAGVYADCSIVQINKETHATRRLNILHTGTPFYQNRIKSTAAGDGKVFFGTNSAKSRYSGDLIWYDVETDRVYIAAGPNPEDVYYAPAGVDYVWYHATTGELANLDITGDGVVDKYDSLITEDGQTRQRFTGVIENQMIVSMVYKDGYIYGCSSKAGGSGTQIDTYPGNAVLFVYDVANFQVVATYDLSVGIPSLATPILWVDMVAEDPDVPGKFWGVVSDTLFSFTFDHETELFHVNMELSLGRSEYKGINWRDRDILFDGDFMYVPFGSKGIYMIEKDDPTNFYRLTTIVPSTMLMAEDNNIYYIDGDQDMKVLYTAQVTGNIKAADAVRAQIAAIGNVTLESENAIKAARAAYDALTAEQNALVKNADVLTAAEIILSELKNSVTPPTGDRMPLTALVCILTASTLAFSAVYIHSKKKRA